MSLAERAADIYCQRVLGIRREFDPADPNINLAAITALTLRAQYHVSSHRSVLDGYSIQDQGAAIVTGNHNRESDIYKGWEAIRRFAHRMPFTLVRMSLISPDDPESPEFLASLGGQQDRTRRYNPISAFTVGKSGIYGINREHPDPKGGDWFNWQLAKQRLGCLYMQGTRHENGLLEDLQPGAAIFAKRHPEIPVYFLFSSGHPDGPDKLTVAKPTTYNEAVEIYGEKLSIPEFIIYLADKGAEVAPPRVQDDWWQRTRQKELERLCMRKKKPSKVAVP